MEGTFLSPMEWAEVQLGVAIWVMVVATGGWCGWRGGDTGQRDAAEVVRVSG